MAFGSPKRSSNRFVLVSHPFMDYNKVFVK
jgi:hypothetical protein